MTLGGLENTKETEDPHKDDISQVKHGQGVKDRTGAILAFLLSWANIPHKLFMFMTNILINIYGCVEYCICFSMYICTCNTVNSTNIYLI